MSTLSLSPVSAAIFTVLNVSAVTSLANGPADTDVPQLTAFPYVWYVVSESNARGFGTGGLRRIDFRVHAAALATSSKGPAKEVQAILAAVVLLLEDASLTISGYSHCGKVFYDSTTEPLPSEIAGKSCWEAVSNFYTWVEP